MPASSLGDDLLRDRDCHLLYPSANYQAYHELGFQLIYSRVDM